MLLWTVVAGAAAQDCDVAALKTELGEATPASSPAIYMKLAECDAPAAAAATGGTITTWLGDDAAYNAARASINAGADDAVVLDWVKGLQSNQRAAAIATLGDGCSEEVAAFFAAAHSSLGDDFWNDRYYRGLEECHDESSQAILQAEIDQGVGADRARFTGVLETYARNLGAKSLDKLVALLEEFEDAELLGYVLNAFGDAARVGSAEGMDYKTAQAGAKAIAAAAPSIPSKAIPVARNTLNALEAEPEADSMAQYYYADLAQPDGTFLWGTVVVENAVCKNGKKKQAVHYGQVVDDGDTWADQIEEKVTAAVELGWELDLAEGCKGEGQVEVHVPETPFSSVGNFKSWADEKATAAADDEAKSVRFDHEPINL